MRYAAAVIALGVLISACSNATQAVVRATPVAAAPVIGPALDRMDQPSFASRSGRPPALSLQELFHPTYNVPTDPSMVRTLLVTGDIIPARGVAYFAAVRRDYLWPFRPTADFTKNADITYISLEAPLLAGCPVSPASSFTFCGDPRFINGLTFMGAKVANLANNHLTNYGAAGVASTDQLLSSHGILSSGLAPLP
jgi:hypothetical protein